MLFNGIDLKVYHIEDAYIVATNREMAINHYISYDNETTGEQCTAEDISIIHIIGDLETEGVNEMCYLDYAIDFIKTMDTDKSITIIKNDDEFYSLFISFKDLITESTNEEWFKNIENEPYIIAWNE